MGILGLITEMFTLSHRMSEMKEMEQFTGHLKATNDALRRESCAELKEAVGQGDILSKTNDNADAKTLNADRQRIEVALGRYKLISSAAVPLGEQGILFDATTGNLTEWHTLLERNYKAHASCPAHPARRHRHGNPDPTGHFEPLAPGDI